MNGSGLRGLLPMLPWEGPPLPRFLGLFWPWTESGGQDSAAETSAGVLYQNSEEIEIVRDAEGYIQKVIRHIRVTKDE